jgi:GDP-L-fucose synthase
MLLSTIVKNLYVQDFSNIIARTHSEFDLTNKHAAQKFFQKEKSDHFYLVAAKVDGIHASNTCSVELIYENHMMEANIVNQAFPYSPTPSLFRV